MSRKNFATLLFVLALVFFAGEVFAVCTAKNQYDYRRTKETSEELSVELSLISAALNSGNKKLYNDSVSRFRATFADFTNNTYAIRHQDELIDKLRDYDKKIDDNKDEINELMELTAALSALRSELQDSSSETLDASNFYQIQQVFQTLDDTLDGIKTQHLSELKQRLESFAHKIIDLAKNSAVCVSVCPKSSFSDKQKSLEKIEKKYKDEFTELGKTVSDKYNPSDLIVELGNI